MDAPQDLIKPLAPSPGGDAATRGPADVGSRADGARDFAEVMRTAKDAPTRTTDAADPPASNAQVPPTERSRETTDKDSPDGEYSRQNSELLQSMLPEPATDPVSAAIASAQAGNAVSSTVALAGTQAGISGSAEPAATGQAVGLATASSALAIDRAIGNALVNQPSLGVVGAADAPAEPAADPATIASQGFVAAALQTVPTQAAPTAAAPARSDALATAPAAVNLATAPADLTPGSIAPAAPAVQTFDTTGVVDATAQPQAGTSAAAMAQVTNPAASALALMTAGQSRQNNPSSAPSNGLAVTDTTENAGLIDSTAATLSVESAAASSTPAGNAAPNLPPSTAAWLDMRADGLSLKLADRALAQDAAAAVSTEIEQMLQSLDDQLATLGGTQPGTQPGTQSTGDADGTTSNPALLAQQIGQMPASTSATDGGAPPVRLTVNAPVEQSSRWATEFSDRLAWVASNRLSAATLQVNPPQLGPIEVRILLNGDQANVSFAAVQPQTRDAIQQALPTLASSLAAQGLSLGQASVGRENPQQQQGNGGSQPSVVLAARGAASLERSISANTRTGDGLIDTFA
jgi:flagellar hook-length control protein FliK